MPNIGGPELLIVLLIFMLLFGWKKLPDLGSSMAKSIKNFKSGMEDDDSETKSEDAGAASPRTSENGSTGSRTVKK